MIHFKQTFLIAFAIALTALGTAILLNPTNSTEFAPKVRSNIAQEMRPNAEDQTSPLSTDRQTSLSNVKFQQSSPPAAKEYQWPSNPPPQQNQQPSFSKSPAQPRSPSELVAGLSEEDLQTLAELPPMCTSDLPGIDLSSGKAVPARLAKQQAARNSTAPTGNRIRNELVDQNPQAPNITASQDFNVQHAANWKQANGDGSPTPPGVAQTNQSFKQPNNAVAQAVFNTQDPSRDSAVRLAAVTEPIQVAGLARIVPTQSQPNQFQSVRTQPPTQNFTLNSAIETAYLAPNSRLTSTQPFNRYPIRVASADPKSKLPNPHAKATKKPAAKKSDDDETNDEDDPHLDIYSRTAFPSAKECATCHEQIYEEWSSSSHAYASVSPMFHKFENKINRLAQGTLGYFCLRCHAPVATTMGLRRDQAIWDGPRVFREGVTCVACHRVKTPYTKANGERRIEPGDIYEPVYGSGDGSGVDIANKYNGFFKAKTNRNDKGPGQPIHKRSIEFEELSESAFCMSCHQVDVKPGIKLEVVWDQYRASPACKEGISCQDCHMGKVPGVNAGYSIGPAAVVNDKVVNPERQHSNHNFFGPGYSIAHPGTFPDNLEADRWKFNDWLTFDWRAGWGTDEFEEALEDGKIYMSFPQAWQEADDRYDAREIIDENLEKLAYKKDLRRQVLENGSKLDGPFFTKPPQLGKPLQLRYCLTNTNPGHNMPSGSLGAQPQIWMNAALRAPSGQLIWESGYLDSNGDLCDNHSLDVLARKVPFDTQLMNLQTKFLTTNVKGTDREMYLPVNFDFDQLPFLRPASQPVTVINHPPFIRMEGHSIPALGSRQVKYSVPSRLIQQPGVYTLSVRMRSRAEPIYFMRFCESTPEMERMMNEYIADFHTSTVTFEIQ